MSSAQWRWLSNSDEVMVHLPCLLSKVRLLLLLCWSICRCAADAAIDCAPFRCGSLSNVTFPFAMSGSACGASPSFHLNHTDCVKTNYTPKWDGFSNCAQHPSFCSSGDTPPLEPPFITNIYDQPSGHTTRQGIPEQLGSSNRPYGFLNLTWLEEANRTRRFCEPFDARNISYILPPTIDLNDFANSTFQFSPYTVFLLFNCSNWTANSKSALQVGATDNSSLCQSYHRYCADNASTISDSAFTSRCVQITPWKVLMLQDILTNLSCTHFSYFVNLSNSTFGASNSSSSNLSKTNTRTVIQLMFSHSDLSSEGNCQACERSGGWCGFQGSNNSVFQCFCSANVTSDTVCINKSSTNQIMPSSSSSHRTTVVLVVSIGIMGFVALAGVVVLWSFYRKQKWSPIVVTASSSPSMKKLWTSQRVLSLAARHHPISKFCKEFSLQELMQATDCFADETMVADGGFGAVYMGYLKDGQKVAIKRFYHDNYKRLEHFYNEIRILSNLNHPNLVKLYGFCCQDETDLLLVYEYASNGSLADQLHNSLDKVGMPWKLRLKIAWETADALSYLHSSVSPPIYHRDVKSANILLDDAFHVKLADFGLSRYVPLDVTHISTMPQGTPGYVDPDYHQSYQLTDKSDVYSFGVVLVELISAKLAVDITRAKGEVNLSTWAVTKISCEEWEELIDPRLSKNDPYMENTVKAMGELAFLCLQPERDNRPTMHHVSDVLAQLWKWYDKMWHLEEGAKVENLEGQDAFMKEYSPMQLKDGCFNDSCCSNSPTLSVLLTSNNSSLDNVSCTEKLLQPNSLDSSLSSRSFSSSEH